MRNKIPCSANNLNLLEPTMIQAVVEASVFKLASQYLAENRVRVLEADAVHINSAVIGNSGMHEQTIQLRDGMLVSQCSCPLTEQPMCRHCVAVVLEYHRWAKPQPQRAAPSKPAQKQRQGAAEASDMNLRALTGFVEWFQVAVSALDQKHPLPESPKLDSEQVQSWVESIQQVATRRRELEAERLALKTDLDNRDAQINRLTQQVQASVKEIKDAQAAAQALRHELTGYRAVTEKVLDMAKDLERFESEVRRVAGDLATQGSHLSSLSDSVKKTSTGLRDLSKRPTS